jgi:hypothetical protein
MSSSLSSDRQAQIRPLDRRNNPAMLEILRQSPIETGGLSICFDRQPDIFAMADLKYAPAAWRGFFESDTLAGFGMVGYHAAYVNGSVTPVMHITDCYIRPGSRGRGYLKSALEYFLDEGAGRAQIGYAVVMKRNRAAEAQIGDRFAGTPCGLKSRIIGDLVARTIVLAYPRRTSTHFKVRRARLDDIDDVVSLLKGEHQPRLFGLVVDRDEFVAQLKRRPSLSIDDYYVVERAGKLEGVCAAWDTSAFKQNRVVRYGLGLNLVRAASVLTARIGGFPTLPRPGEAFRDVFLTDWAARDRSEEVMYALIEHIYHEYRDRSYHTMIFGSCARDPVLRAARRFPGSDLVSHIALMSLGGNGLEYDARLPFIDLALL